MVVMIQERSNDETRISDEENERQSEQPLVHNNKVK